MHLFTLDSEALSLAPVSGLTGVSGLEVMRVLRVSGFQGIFGVQGFGDRASFAGLRESECSTWRRKVSILNFQEGCRLGMFRESGLHAPPRPSGGEQCPPCMSVSVCVGAIREYDSKLFRPRCYFCRCRHDCMHIETVSIHTHMHAAHVS